MTRRVGFLGFLGFLGFNPSARAHLAVLPNLACSSNITPKTPETPRYLPEQVRAGLIGKDRSLLPGEDLAMSSQAQPIDLTTTTARIAEAYVSGNRLPAADLPGVLRTIHGALMGLGAPQGPSAPAKATEAQIRASIRPDAIVSFEDGKPYKALRRHLTMRGLTPEAYRAKHGLPVTYPMTSAEYGARRSEISRRTGLGRQAPMQQAAE